MVRVQYLFKIKIYDTLNKEWTLVLFKIAQLAQQTRLKVTKYKIFKRLIKVSIIKIDKHIKNSQINSKKWTTYWEEKVSLQCNLLVKTLI